MKKLILVALGALFMVGGALAADNMSSNMDKKDDMKKEQMIKDNMSKKDGMMKDEMKKDMKDDMKGDMKKGM